MRTLAKVLVLLLISHMSILHSRSDIIKSDLSNDGFIQNKANPILENRVHRAGLFWMNITNSGYFGNPDLLQDPCTGTTSGFRRVARRIRYRLSFCRFASFWWIP